MQVQRKHWQLCVWGLPLTRRSSCCLLRLAKTLSCRAVHMNAGHRPHHATTALACQMVHAQQSLQHTMLTVRPTTLGQACLGTSGVMLMALRCTAMQAPT